MRVVVIGAGVGGLTLAVALHLTGVEVSVHERTVDGASPGNGLGLAANGRRVLADLGVDPRAKGLGAALASMRLRRTGGDDLAHYDLGGGGLLGIRRADLGAVLLGALPTGTVHFGRECVDVHLADRGARVEFADGEGIDADVVVGADGLRSTVAARLVPRTPLEDSGQVVLRGFAATDGLDPEVARAQVAWLGADRHLLTYPVDADGTSVVAGFVPRHLVAGPDHDRRPLHDALVSAFEGWHVDVAALSERAESVTRHELADRAPFRPWSRGRVCLLGDAAHPMLPHAGQGANLAIEDAAVLAVLLAESASRPGTDPERALLHYERTRRARTERVQTQARRNGRLFSGGAAGSGASRPTDLSWIYDHDAPAVARNAATHLPTR